VVLFLAALACSDGSGSPDGSESTGATGGGSLGGGANAASGGSSQGIGGAPGSGGAVVGSGGAASPDGGSPATGGAAGGSPPEAYPAGPYGQNNPGPGAILENLAFRGYANPTGVGLATGQPLIDYSLAQFRLTGPRYALVHIGAVW
jgi:hypothetical protein